MFSTSSDKAECVPLSDLDPGHVREPETCFTRLPMMSYPRFETITTKTTGYK
jgi:hypothetical protein